MSVLSMSSSELGPLPYPVYFICKQPEVWGDLMNSDRLPPPIEETYYQRYCRTSPTSNYSWCVQTYIQLRHHGVPNVYLTKNYKPGALCVASYEGLGVRDFPFNSYVVACRHDRGRPEICEQRIVQNQLNIQDKTDFYMPHWPQPALNPRDSSRGDVVRVVAFKGREKYLAEPFRTPEFLTQLAEMGIELRGMPHIAEKDDLESLARDWADYSEIDVVIAVRNCTDYDLSIKPPSKLINAWLAGCPAILGPEPAYQQFRRSELDYIEVRSPEEAIAALKHLQANPDLYQAMVANGRERGREFTADAMAKRWHELLTDITEDYARWRQASALQRYLGRPIQFLWRAYRHDRERQRFMRSIHEGPRPFG